MKKLLPAILVFTAFFMACTSSKKNATAVTKLQPSPVYEMRTYYAAAGKLEDLSARFRNNTTRIFSKHGMTNIGYWIPLENPENKLIYILSYPSREARETAWKAFGADPEWQAVAKASEANGKLVNKVESVFMQQTDYSPRLQAESKNPTRTFELRTYTASPGNIQNLHDRFRNHTMKLFEKHGITNIAYWQPMTTGDATGSNLLIYLIAHPDKATGDASWKAFREDPTWVKVKSDSEVKGGGSLTTKVESVFMSPTDYSPLK
jgi:NIPSNAP